MNVVKSLKPLVAFVSCLSLTALVGSPAVADVDDIGVKSRLVACCASYFTTVNAKTIVTYDNEVLPEGTQVFLRYGYTVSEHHGVQLVPKSHWNDLTVVPMTEQDDGTHQVEIEKTVINRGASTQITGLDFLLELHVPDGRIAFDKGSAAALGYYQVSLPQAGGPCYPWSEEFCPLTVDAVRQN